MSEPIKIQVSIFCEPCIICGSRPVIAQAKGKFIVRCGANPNHYQTPPGMVDIANWNKHNRREPDFTPNIGHLKQG
ncbi:hypothetical protein ACQ86K_23785 [Mucilaginibacter sp. P19]|uniref:Uncharacterized protein n=1 Tax=Mucilaginibacter gossypii TaxID=551996 RepID=A0A1G8KR43_9SPHI|nr:MULTISPECIES: hypothetical protein [Mucilaginibacter]QTE39996.1 hypothetical protein J3L18_13385 [Mucilaginibacter gossypii]RAV54336.1 hypothetical protein DIU36_21015 [Mucilaginibacter rubeus]SDI45898.1 hypothetical protein SAMN05192573_12145 [Mucilaginibacter gossypii]